MGSCPSNTSPATYRVPRARVPAAGIDSLYLGYVGMTSGAFRNGARNAIDTLYWGGDCFNVLGPRGFYNLVLDNERVNLAVATRDCPQNTPSVYVQLKAEAIWSIGLRQCRQNLIDLMESVFEHGVEREIVSRVDLYADVIWERGFKDLDSRRFVSRAKHRQTNVYGSAVTGFQIGKGSIQARIYNKTLEVLRKGKEWRSPLWHIEKSTPIWRVEFQFRRPSLSARGIDSFEDLLQNRQALWSYASSKWLRMCSHSKGNQSRRPTTRFWELVQSALMDQCEGASVMTPSLRSPGMKREDAVRQIAGVVKSHCRYLGVSEHSLVLGGMIPEIKLLLSRAENAEKLRRESIQMTIESSALVN
jgi:hypothetical protein